MEQEPGILNGRAREIAAEIEAAEYARIPIEDLTLWEKNPRTGMDEGSSRLASTIGAVGWGADVLVQRSTRRVIGGHLRIRAARKLGLDVVPCKLLDVDDRRADEIALADNRAAEFASWEPVGLRSLLEELDPERRSAIGWSEAELVTFLAGLAPPKPPPEPEPALHAESDATIEVVCGPNLEVLPKYPDASFDAIVTDPPYGLAFMGRDWDKALPDPATWAELLRVAKPGAHLVAFGAPRLYHRLGVAIEDAGWELRDCLVWLFGTGFPKSLDVSKALDAAAGAERSDRIVTDSGAMIQTSDPPQPARSVVSKGTPVTEDAARWSGWGTALKPAWEPILLARKPLAGTVAANVLEHGTGGINVDGTRIGTEGGTRDEGYPGTGLFGIGGNATISDIGAGRWPANVVLDEEAAARLDGEVGELASRGNIGSSVATGPPGAAYAIGAERPSGAEYTYGDAGGASRFFYTAKASRAEREAGLAGVAPRVINRETPPGTKGAQSPRAGAGRSGRRANAHPTVKPVALMQWLVRLVTPPGGKVLDPFGGSGSTGVACQAEGFDAVLVELDPAHAKTARGRLGQTATGKRRKKRKAAK